MTTTSKNILIVEDDEDIVGPMAKAIKDIGHNITAVFPAGEEAINLIKFPPHPDLIIMDVILAGPLDGIETGRYIEEQLHLPIIYMTGFYNKAILLKNAGKVPLIKPFTLRELKTVIEVAFYVISLQEAYKQDAANWPKKPLF